MMEVSLFKRLTSRVTVQERLGDSNVRIISICIHVTRISFASRDVHRCHDIKLGSSYSSISIQWIPGHGDHELYSSVIVRWGRVTYRDVF